MSVVLIWCAAFATYLLLAGQLSSHEVETGIVLASLATAWPRAIRAFSHQHFRFLPDLWRPLGRGLGQVIPATFATGRVLVRAGVLGGHAGRSRVHGFEYGARAGTFGQSVERTRRAIAVLLASCAPDRFIVNVDRESETVLVHTIVQGQEEPDPQWLT